MIATGKAFVTAGTRESFLARVRSQMALQLIGAREPLAAKQPITDERSLAGVPAQVRF